MRIILFITLALFPLGILAQFNNENLSIPEEAEVSRLYSFSKLKIYPIRANDNFRSEFQDLEKYTTLERAIKEKKIRISEVSESGEVNSLYAKNISKEPIYLMAGEVVKGGKQDRIIGQDIVLAPGESKNLDAFCVERGRWNEGNTGGDFKEYVQVSSNGIRKAAVVDKDQSKVWSNVAKVTGANHANSATGAYTELKNSKSYNDEVDRYMKRFKSAWDNDPNVVGIVAVSGDKVIGCDIFATHDLFVNAYSNLMHSYIAEALTNGGDVKIGKLAVTKYLDQFLNDEKKQDSNLKGKGSVFRHKGKKIHVSKF